MVQASRPNLPSLSYLKLTKSLPRKQTSLLTQLRTEHIPLQVHLHRIGKADSAQCPSCGHAKETVHHYLLDCPTYE